MLSHTYPLPTGRQRDVSAGVDPLRVTPHTQGKQRATPPLYTKQGVACPLHNWSSASSPICLMSHLLCPSPHSQGAAPRAWLSMSSYPAALSLSRECRYSITTKGTCPQPSRRPLLRLLLAAQVVILYTTSLQPSVRVVRTPAPLRARSSLSPCPLHNFYRHLLCKGAASSSSVCCHRMAPSSRLCFSSTTIRYWRACAPSHPAISLPLAC